MTNFTNYTQTEWNELIDQGKDCNLKEDIIEDQLKRSSNNLSQNITLQVNDEEEEKYYISSKTLNNINNHKLNLSCSTLDDLSESPNSTQISIESLTSQACFNARERQLFHQNLEKELNKVIPTPQRKNDFEASNHNLDKCAKVENYFNANNQKEETKNNYNSNNCASNQKLTNESLFVQKADYSGSGLNSKSINLVNNNTYETLNSNKLTSFNSMHSLVNGETNLLKPPCLSGKSSSILSRNELPNLSTPKTILLDPGNFLYKNVEYQRKRCISKNGVANIRNAKISRKNQRFFLDFFNTMIDIEWHINLLTFAASFVISWLFFAVIWWLIAYQHGDLYNLNQIEEINSDLDKMDVNLNVLTENLKSLANPSIYSKVKRSTITNQMPKETIDGNEILNTLARNILHNRTTIQQLIEDFNLSKFLLNSTSEKNLNQKINDEKNLKQFLNYAKNNSDLKQTFDSHNVSLNKFHKLVKSKLILTKLNTSSDQYYVNDLNEIKFFNENNKNSNVLNANSNDSNLNVIHNLPVHLNDKFKLGDDFSLTTSKNEEQYSFPLIPITKLTIEQKHQLENLFYLMQLNNLLQHERYKQQIVKFLIQQAKTTVTRKINSHHFQSKPPHPPHNPPPHPLPASSTSAIQAKEEEQLEKLEAARLVEAERKQKQLKLNKQQFQASNKNFKEEEDMKRNSSEITKQQKKQDTKLAEEQTDKIVNEEITNNNPLIEEVKTSESLLSVCSVNGTKKCRKTCLDNINSFTDAILFSIETQHTIGYGTRQPTDECKIVLIILMLQSIFGCLIQCFVVGFVFAKLSRPQNRHQTLIFSKRAVLNLSENDQKFDNPNDSQDNQLKLNFDELNDLVNLIKSGEMSFSQESSSSSESGYSSNNMNGIHNKMNLNSFEQRRNSDDVLSTDEDLVLNSKIENQNLTNLNYSSKTNFFSPQANLTPNVTNQNHNFNFSSNQNRTNLLSTPTTIPGLNSKRSSNVSFLSNFHFFNRPSIHSNINTFVNQPEQSNLPIDYTGNKYYRLEFRVGDVREKSHIINAKISAYLLNQENHFFKQDLFPAKSNTKFRSQLRFRKRQSEVDYSNLRLNSTIQATKTENNFNELDTGRKLHNFTQKKLPLTIDNVDHSDGDLLLIWPIVVSHEINERSPLYNISREEMLTSKFEIIIVLEGTIESTGQSVQARTSYLPNEILWGEKFLPLLQSDNENSEFLVNFSMFNLTKSQNMPSFSAKEYELRKKYHKLCILKQYLDKLSDNELNQNNSDNSNLNINNLNLLRHLLTQNDNNNLNGLINNMDDLNNLNNLLITLNKLVDVHNSNNSFHGNVQLNNNLTNQNNTFNTQTLSFGRKKSSDITQLMENFNHSNREEINGNKNKSKSINYLNNLLLNNQLNDLYKIKSLNNLLNLNETLMNIEEDKKKFKRKHSILNVANVKSIFNSPKDQEVYKLIDFPQSANNQSAYLSANISFNDDTNQTRPNQNSNQTNDYDKTNRKKRQSEPHVVFQKMPHLEQHQDLYKNSNINENINNRNTKSECNLSFN